MPRRDTAPRRAPRLLLAPALALCLALGAGSPAAAGTPEKGHGLHTGGILDSLKMPTLGGFGLFFPGILWRAIGMHPRMVPGEWYRYALTQPDHAPSKLQVSVIPSTRFKGRDRILELEMTRPTGEKSWVKMVVHGRLDRDPTVKRLMLEQSTMPPIELPLGLTGKRAARTHFKAKHPVLLGGHRFAGVTYERLGKVTLKTKVGAIRTVHVRLFAPGPKKGGRHRVADIWAAPSVVHLWGIVKITVPGKPTMILTARGKGAVTDLPDFARRAPHRPPAPDQGKGKDRVK